MGLMPNTTHRRKGGVIVQSVTPDSAAEECGIQPGDTIFSINDHVIPDSLSFTFNIAAPNILMLLDKPDGERWELEIEHDPGEPFGVTLREDPIMLCRNKCIFCFVDQNPKGYRQSLLIKDEDIRLSFMYGNYSTLSSTDAQETERIIREKIQPLYVSVHATDPDVRIFMLKNKKCGDILQRLAHFAENGIDFHCQIVLCPGINDGPVLERTLNELASLWPMTRSIAVVPLGITAHRAGLTQLTPVSDAYCRETIAFVKPFQRRFKKDLGYPLIFLGDEFYIRAGVPLPGRKAYRDFPQMENGIGMVRRFIEGFKRRLPKADVTEQTSGTLVTGTLFGPALQQLVANFNATHGTALKVAPIRNESFGPELINVAGLVHAKDTVKQLMGRDLGQFVLIPEVMLKDREDQLFIDDYRPNDVANQLNVPVVLSGNQAGDLVTVLKDWRAYVVAEPNRGRPQSAPSPSSEALVV